MNFVNFVKFVTFRLKNKDGSVIKAKGNVMCKSCSDTGRFQNYSDKKGSRDSMLPISFIPMDAIHHLYEIFDFVMKARCL